LPPYSHYVTPPHIVLITPITPDTPHFRASCAAASRHFAPPLFSFRQPQSLILITPIILHSL
jgi:hypothetical protein